ncbi:septation protein SepH [Terrabacter sp. C0L_2]|uniref:septation protein SepH n=1 Tax=Terrabacter sp. C0L_2 TaxID=3108389 RepID=UPI002ED53452|nr:septation protein SepH [Terrabacter sp. C0L_2]
MQHLRLVGVHEDGLHLLLADDEGNRYSVPLDEALRAAARRDRPRLGQLQIEVSGGLRPKDVQSMIRAGMTAEEVAERAGWTVEKVHRYEGPILAEREHVAGLARQVRLRPRGGSHGGAPTLDARVSERLRTREIDAGAVRWDSRRTDKGAWTVLLAFNAGGREREAAWQFDPLARTVSAVDDEARWLSEDEDQQAPGPIPAPHLAASTRPSRVYDVEAEGGVGAAVPRRREGETVDLMAAMRERSSQRGRRRRPRSTEVPGLDEAPEEALPLEELAADPRDELPPPAHTHPEDDPEVVKTGTVEQRVGVEAAQRKARRTEPTQPVRQVPERPSEADPGPVAEARPEVERDARVAVDDDHDDRDHRGVDNADDHAEDHEELRDDHEGDESDVAQQLANRASGVDASVRPERPERPAHPRATDRAADHRQHDSAPALDDAREDDLIADVDSDLDEGLDDEPAEERPLRPAARRRQEPRPVSRIPAEGRRSGSGSGSPGASGARSFGGDGDGDDVVEQRVPAARPKPAPRPAQAARKSGRPSVPSWDDIMFGRKNE